nr:pyridoxamine 5'-phosphate oxidase family protein [Paenibacillus sp. J31TS4]
MLVLTRQELETKIQEAVRSNQACAFATIEGNKPKVRYMMLFQDGMTLYMATDRKSHKVDELEANPHVSLVAGYDGTWTSPVLELEGTARVSDDPSLKQRFWSDELFRKYFEGPDDPDYVLLEVKPTRILYAQDDRVDTWEQE